LGAQVHSLRAREYFCLKMGRNVGAQLRLATFLLRKNVTPI
jgi:hypothetical protein